MHTVTISNVHFIAFVFIVCIRESMLTEFTHDRKRIGPMNLVMAEHGCLQKFTVSENTIIRTQDSRILGAKFLNESDVGNREDCLTLCCNTRYCDVAVFQEKSPFSCYLFDCGPPDDFVCKFTSHTYYTSAVLTINRHQLDLGLWSTQHQHEAELVDLRSPPGEIEKQDKDIFLSRVTLQSSLLPTRKTTTTTTSSTTTVPVTTPAAMNAAEAIATQPTVDRKCSRFQFECHSGECLAIYNACDGIPQCRDGSDEGANLSCPQAGADLEVISSQPLPPKTPVGYQGPANENDWNPQPTSGRRKYGQDRGIFNHRGNILEYNRQSNEGSPDYAAREDSLGGYGGHGKGPGYYEYSSRSSMPSRYVAAGRQGGDVNGDAVLPIYQHDYPEYGQRERQPLQSQQLQPLHKQHSLSIQSNLPLKPLPIEQNIPLQYQPQRQELPSGQQWQGHDTRYLPYPAELQPSIQFDPQLGGQLMPLSNSGYNSPAAHSRIMQNLPVQTNSYLSNVQDQVRSYPSSQVQSNPLLSNSDHLRTDLKPELNINNKPLIQNLGDTQVAVVPLSQPIPVFGNLSLSTKQTPLIQDSVPTPFSRAAPPISNTKNSTNTTSPLNTLNPHPDDLPVNPPESSSGLKSKAVNKTSNLIVSHNILSRLEVDLEELTREDENQKSQTSGAVLALSLGVCVTALLIVLVGCRIKGVKRRVRRRRGMRSPLEHDADYLVNGMYL